MASIGELAVEDAACNAAGNWRSWSCFLSYRETDVSDSENWAIIYTHNRDSGLLAQSNAQAISQALESFTSGADPDVVLDSHSHWAVGHVDGFSIRVCRDRRITDAFRSYHSLMDRLGEYPIVDESHYGRREYEAALENLEDAAWRIKSRYRLPEGWEVEAHAWLSENRPGAMENRDDQGACPAEQNLLDAFEALGYQRLGNKSC
jgi:hypothetical protein